MWWGEWGELVATWFGAGSDAFPDDPGRNSTPRSLGLRSALGAAAAALGFMVLAWQAYGDVSAHRDHVFPKPSGGPPLGRFADAVPAWVAVVVLAAAFLVTLVTVVGGTVDALDNLLAGADATPGSPRPYRRKARRYLGPLVGAESRQVTDCLARKRVIEGAPRCRRSFRGSRFLALLDAGDGIRSQAPDRVGSASRKRGRWRLPGFLAGRRR